MSVRGAWCIQESSISDELLSHLQSNINFVSLEEKELESNGFTRCIDMPSIPNHIYYEGYFHGLSSTSGAVNSMNPRLGLNMMKPAAPISLRAFINSFKELNKIWINNAVKDTFIEKLGLSLNLFCDFAVQIHFGDHIDDKSIGWHMDSVNSMLHLAISLHGRRALYYKTNKDMVKLNNNEEKANDNDDDKKERIKIKWQNAGQVYLSSPYAFMHGVEYPKCEWKDKIIAIQCRWLFDMDQYNLIIDHHKEWIIVMNQITHNLRNANVKIPNLSQVIEMEQKIAKKQTSSDVEKMKTKTEKEDTCIIL